MTSLTQPCHHQMPAPILTIHTYTPITLIYSNYYFDIMLNSIVKNDQYFTAFYF